MKYEAKILICYNAPASIYSIYSGKPGDQNDDKADLSEQGFSNEINHVKKSLKKYFTEVETLSIDKNLQRTIDLINKSNPDAILNFVESVEGIAEYEYSLAGLYPLLGFNYTGSVPSVLGNCLDKKRAKEILSSFGIPTPKSIILKPSANFTKKDIKLTYPLILKLKSEDASIGISELSVVKSYTELRKQFNFLSTTYKKEILVEEYIKGREINVAILGDKVLPVSEIIFEGLPSNLPKIVTYDGKWIEDSVYYNNTKPMCPAKLSTTILKRIERIALEAFSALNCRDYARVDLRLDKKNNPYVIEVNPNPDISRDSGFARAAKAAGISHEQLIFTITNFALIRKKNDTQNKAV